MTITSETTKSPLYSGNGVTTAFASGFKILQNPETSEAEVEVYKLVSGVESLVSSSDYVVTGAGLDAGGTITFTVAPPSGTDIIIKSAVSKTQETDLINQGASFRETYETMVDRVVRMVQEQQETLDRGLSVSITSGASGSSVTPENGKVLGWNGTSLINYTPNANAYFNVSSFMATVLDDADASTALTTLGVSTYAKTLLDDTSAGAALTTLGVSAYAQTILDDTTAANALTTLGVSAFAQTVLDDTSASAARTTLVAAASGANSDITSLAGLTGGGTLSNYTPLTSFTPGITFNGGSTGMTFGTRVGKYMRIGTLIIGWIDITLTAKGSSTGSPVLITGLPVANGIGGNAYCATQIDAGTGASLTGYTVAGVIQNGATTVLLRKYKDGSDANMADTDFQNTTTVRVNFSYSA